MASITSPVPSPLATSTESAAAQEGIGELQKELHAAVSSVPDGAVQTTALAIVEDGSSYGNSSSIQPARLKMPDTADYKRMEWKLKKLDRDIERLEKQMDEMRQLPGISVDDRELRDLEAERERTIQWLNQHLHLRR